MYLKMSSKTKHSSYGARVWVTKTQLERKYTPEIALKIIQAKLADPEAMKSQVKSHPDLPDDEAGKHTLKHPFFVERRKKATSPI